MCDPAISALHFSYALTQAAEEEDDSDADRCELQSPRPNHSPCDSPVSFLVLDSSRPHKSSTATSATPATVPSKHRRLVDKVEEPHRSHRDNSGGLIEPKPSPNTSVNRATDGSPSPVGSSNGSNGKKQDWLQSSLGRLAFRRRTADDRTSALQQNGGDVIEVSEKTVLPSMMQMRKLSLPLPHR